MAGGEVDTLITTGGDTLIALVKYKDFEEVIYLSPYNKVVKRERMSGIRELRLAGGVIHSGAPDLTATKEKKQFKQSKKSKNKSSSSDKGNVDAGEEQIVVCFRREELPADAVFKGTYTTDFTGKYNSTNEELEKGCVKVMKKEAFQHKATHLLITGKEFFRFYGENPVIQMRGEFYGRE